MRPRPLTRQQAETLAGLNLLSPLYLRLLGRACNIAIEHGLLDELSAVDRDALLEIAGSIMGASPENLR